MDIWSVKNDDAIDVRVSRENMMWLKQLGVYCTILHDSVEQLVRQFEQKLTVKQEWFEEYVSCTREELVWRRPPLRIESKGLVKYKYPTISKGIQLDSVRMLVTSVYCSAIRTKALSCQDDDV